MGRVVLGMFVGLMIASVGLYWWQGKAQVEMKAPPPPDIVEIALPMEELPVSDPGDMEGPEPPEASELTREQRRFFRYDRNRDLIISRNEMLSTRSDGFRKLDVDGNNLLTFEEWAVTTANRFDGADEDADGELTAREFASTAPARAPRRSNCRC